MSFPVKDSICSLGRTGTATRFLDLAGEIRNEIYKLVLLRDKAIDPWLFKFAQTKHALGLLAVNKTLYREATTIFYGENCFKFIENGLGTLNHFFENIGSINSSLIRHVLIEFPEFSFQTPVGIAIEHGYLDIFASIQAACMNLTTIETSQSSTDYVEQRLLGLNSHKLVTEAITSVADCFTAFPSMPRIILHLDEQETNSHFRKMIANHGWIIRKNRHLSFVQQNRLGERPEETEDNYEADVGIVTYGMDSDGGF